jgi:glycosyltransferase involved in cell wall biosynthesis
VLNWLPSEDVARFLQASNFAVFPFREITNSASVMLAQSFGLPVVISDLAYLSDIPDDSAIRIEPNVESLVTGLLRAEGLSAHQYREMSAAGLAWSARTDWSDIARATVETYRAACR